MNGRRLRTTCTVHRLDVLTFFNRVSLHTLADSMPSLYGGGDEASHESPLKVECDLIYIHFFDPSLGQYRDVLNTFFP